MRIAGLKRNMKTSRAKSHTRGGGKKRAHNIGKNPYRRSSR